ncbi:Synaptotagmin-14 [Halotydeus destructor]|nr:Synaptotagmin-14 [Halotydeus destructor]
MLSPPTDMSAIVVLSGFFVAFIFMFYLYISKKFSIQSVISKATCCDDPDDKTLVDNKQKVQRDLAASYGYYAKDDGYYDDQRASSGHGDNMAEDSSTADSDIETLLRLHRSASQHFMDRRRKISLGRSSHRSSGHSAHSRLSVATLKETPMDYTMAHSESSDRLLDNTSRATDRGESAASGDITTSPTTSTMSTVIEAASVGRTPSGAEGDLRERRATSRLVVSPRMLVSACPSTSKNDPMSMAERGRIGRGASSESADTEEELVPFLRQRSTESRPSTAASELQPTVLRRAPPIGLANSGFQRSTDSEATTSDNSAGRCLSRQTTVSSMTRGQSSTTGSSGVSAKVGTIQVAHSYDPPTKRLQITVIEARDIVAPSPRDRFGFSHVCVRMCLLPNKKMKAKTKTKAIGDNPGGCPQFVETFSFSKIPPDEVLGMGVRFRLYGCERLRRERLIGECVLAFSCSKPLQIETTIRISLEPRSNLARTDSRSDVSSLARSDSTGSTQSVQNSSNPELLVGLAYKSTTGRLLVTVIKGSQFRVSTMSRAPDTHVKLTLVSSSGVEISRFKTSIRRGQTNPLFKETFVFQVALFQVPDVTLMVSVYAKKSMKRKKEMLGWFALGLNSSGQDELCHWNDMRDSRGEQVCRWHVLLES